MRAHDWVPVVAVSLLLVSYLWLGALLFRRPKR